MFGDESFLHKFFHDVVSRDSVEAGFFGDLGCGGCAEFECGQIDFRFFVCETDVLEDFLEHCQFGFVVESFDSRILDLIGGGGQILF